jgi:hypothetical protein
MFMVIWALYSHGMSSIQRTERILESTRAAHVLFELLHRDLKRAREVVIPRATTASAISTGPIEPGDALMYVDLKEYAFRKKTGTVWIEGRPLPLGRFDVVAFDSPRPGLVTFRISPVPSGGLPSDLPMLARAGRFTLEGSVWVEQVEGRANEPTLVGEFRGGHAFCMIGWPLDH